MSQPDIKFYKVPVPINEVGALTWTTGHNTLILCTGNVEFKTLCGCEGKYVTYPATINSVKLTTLIETASDSESTVQWKNLMQRTLK